MSLKKSYAVLRCETIFKGLCVFVSNGDRWDGVKFHFIITLSASLPLMQTDNHIPLKDKGWHNRLSAFAVKAKSPSQFLSARSITSALWKPFTKDLIPHYKAQTWESSLSRVTTFIKERNQKLRDWSGPGRLKHSSRWQPLGVWLNGGQDIIERNFSYLNTLTG